MREGPPPLTSYLLANLEERARDEVRVPECWFDAGCALCRLDPTTAHHNWHEVRTLLAEISRLKSIDEINTKLLLEKGQELERLHLEIGHLLKSHQETFQQNSKWRDTLLVIATPGCPYPGVQREPCGRCSTCLARAALRDKSDE